MRKKKQLEMIEYCQIVYNGNGILAGNSINSWMQFNLKDGQTLYSNKGSKFGFKDFKIKIWGSGKQSWKSKRRLQLKSFYNAIRDPYIHIEAQMIERPDVKLEMHIPINFNGHFRLGFSAASGASGNKGSKGSNGYCGRSDYANGNGENGYWGDRGFNGRNGSHGRNASRVNVYLSMVDFPRDNTELVKVEACYANGKCWTRYIGQSGSIKIFNQGGDGGDGGKGGAGGNGGNGGDGAFTTPRTDDNPGCSREGWGGNGGRGGDGGYGGNGGNGGQGGDVYIYYRPRAHFFVDQVHVYNQGGSAGEGGRGGNAGCGGKAGRGGKGRGYRGDSGNCGPRGNWGRDGRAGNIYYQEWK